MSDRLPYTHTSSPLPSRLADSLTNNCPTNRCFHSLCAHRSSIDEGHASVEAARKLLQEAQRDVGAMITKHEALIVSKSTLFDLQTAATVDVETAKVWINAL